MSIRGRFLILHDRQTVPQEFTILDELKRFPAWRPLACMDMKICGFGEATLEQVCNHLQEKLHLLARGTGDLKIEALEGETRPVTYITQHKITFAEWLWCVAELAGAKIIVEEKRILVMPSSP